MFFVQHGGHQWFLSWRCCFWSLFWWSLQREPCLHYMALVAFLENHWLTPRALFLLGPPMLAIISWRSKVCTRLLWLNIKFLSFNFLIFWYCSDLLFRSIFFSCFFNALVTILQHLKWATPIEDTLQGCKGNFQSIEFAIKSHFFFGAGAMESLDSLSNFLSTSEMGS